MSSLVASTVTVTRSAVASATSAAASNRAASQAGVLEGLNPTEYNSSNPIVLFIIQAGIIIIFCRLLHYPLSYLRQPRVIAEVIGGVILGPSVMMRIPGFKETIFPTASMPILSLVANLGLVLFLFLVGLEVDVRLFSSNWRIALSVGFAGMVLPFGLGCAIAWGLYHEFRSDAGIEPIGFGVYMLFIGTALSITAFPVLCRILTELKLLHTTVGVTVLAAGVGNDVVGWILLALCVALVNNGSGLSALYVLLCCVGWVLALFYVVKPVFHYLLRRSGSIQNGPTQGMVALTILLVLTSAWFTSIIGVHAIFGAFLVGLICPHDGGFAIKLTEKIEDLVSVLFLPLYFALSGLSTNLGALNDGITWGYTIGVIVVAFSGKIIGGTLAAAANKLVWRESLTIGVLMSCKGLVEIIVLNIGLQAKILSTRTFTMFVVMALVTTVATTPLTGLLYPPWYQKKLEAWKRGEIDWDGNRLHPDSDNEEFEKTVNSGVQRLLVYLRLDNLPSLFTFISLLGGDASSVTKIHPSKGGLSAVEEESSTLGSHSVKRPLQVHGVRILELTDRTSSVMKVSEEDEYAFRDPVVNTFRTFAQLNNVAASGEVSIVPESSFSGTLISKASDMGSDLLLIPWSETGSLTEGDSTLLFRGNAEDRYTSTPHNTFIQETLNSAVCNTAVFINRGFGGSQAHAPALKRVVSGISLRGQQDKPKNPISDRSHHVYFPFFGGADDLVALRFVLQMAQSSNVTVSIVHFRVEASTPPGTGKLVELKAPAEIHANDGLVRQRTLSRPGSSAMNFSHTPVPNLDPESLAVRQAQDTVFLHSMRDSLPTTVGSRVVFSENTTSSPMAACLEIAREEVAQSPRNAGDLIVLGRGRSGRPFNDDLGSSGNWNEAREVRRTLGDVAQAVISGSIKASVLVVQAGGRNTDL